MLRAVFILYIHIFTFYIAPSECICAVSTMQIVLIPFAVFLKDFCLLDLQVPQKNEHENAFFLVLRSKSKQVKCPEYLD